MKHNALFYGKVNNAMNRVCMRGGKVLVFMVLLFVLSIGVKADPVGVERARQVAQTFLSNNGAQTRDLREVSTNAGFSNVYVFTTVNSFVLIAADDCVQPILGYSLTGQFDVENIPDNKRAWIQGYSDEIQYAMDNRLRASSEVAQQWRDLMEGNSNFGRATTVVAPLIQTQWGQGSPYNMLCPSNSVTGCVATAMAQVMKYWNYPAHGIGWYSYIHPNYGEQFADFQSTTYDWDNMINSYSGTSTYAQKLAVATLMYHCGVSVDMNYSPSASGAVSAYVADALKTYFNYSTDAQYFLRSNYSNAAWINMLKSDLDQNRPIQYSGSGSGGGHAFVCDGYNSNNYFHFNWGWEGYCDEYYSIDNLNPGPGGIGSGSNGIYNDNQGAILGVHPSECTANTPSNLTYIQDGRNVILSWSAASGASSYNIYCNTGYIGNVSSTSYSDVAPYGNSVYYVRSVDPNGRLSLSSNAVTVVVPYQTPVVDDLAATVSGNNVNLSWTAPEWCFPETPSATLTYGDGSYSGYLGYNGSNTMYWGHRYLSSALSAYDNMLIYKVSFYANSTGTYKLYVYKGTTSNHPQTQVLEQSFSVGSTGWFDIELSNTIEIDDAQDLWVFIYDPEYRNYPATYCSYEGSDGNYYSTSPTSWVSTWDNAAFNIRTFVTDGTYTYNVYRNGSSIANNVTNTSYSDNALAAGIYNYYVKTNYYAGETNASNQVTVQIGTGNYCSILASANPIEGGSVTGSGSYLEGQSCTLTATPNSGYSFSNWTKNGVTVSANATYIFTVTESASYVAHFTAVSSQDMEVVAEYYPDSSDFNSPYVKVYWSEETWGDTFSVDFENGMPDGWIVIDANNDGYTWTLTSDVPSTWTYYSSMTLDWYHSGTNAICSGSFINGVGALTPDEYLISPQLNIANGSQLSFWVAATDASYPADHFGVFVSTTGTNPSDFQSIQEWTLTAKREGKAGGPASRNGKGLRLGSWYNYTIDLSAYAGGARYIAFRHFNCNDQYIMCLDDISLTTTRSEQTTYCVYRTNCDGGEIQMIANNVTENQYIDNGWSGLAAGFYKYGVNVMDRRGDSGDVYDNVCSYVKEGSRTEISWSNCIEKPSSSGNVQVTTFSQGYNWWCTYIEQEGIDGLSILQEGLGDHGVTIRSQVGYTDYYAGYGWYGSLASINNESSYKIKVNAPCSVALTGVEAVPSQHPITLNQGWTWMGYVSSTAMDVNEALSGLESTVGDKLKSQQGYADYYQDYGWFGSLNTIEPGMGLMYYSTNDDPVTFTYPDSSRDGELKRNLTAENNHWKPNTYAYPDNMTVMAVVELDDEELNTEDYELAAFAANGECRGSVRLTYAEPLHRHVAFLTISGKDAAGLSFRLYNTETNEEYYDAEESLDFVANAMVGAADDLYVVHFRGTTGMDELAGKVKVYPNPVNAGERFSIGMADSETNPVHVEIVNELGVETLRATSVQTPVSIVAPATAGVYTLRITVEEKGTVVRKLVVK